MKAKAIAPAQRAWVQKVFATSVIAAALGVAALPRPAAAAVTGSPKFIPTFTVYYGGGPNLTAADAPNLAKFDLIDIDRWRHHAIAPSTWTAVKALNPNTEIYLYQMGPEAETYMDGSPQYYLNGIGRYNISRGHSMGSLNGNQGALFLRDAGGNRIYSVPYSTPSSGQYWWLMDFGTTAYKNYWVEATRADIADQAWRGDGVFVDNCLALIEAGGYNAASTKYPSATSWTNAMNTFVTGITAGMRAAGQKLWCNRGETKDAIGAQAWLTLDASGSAPDIVMEEGVFAVKWGNGVVQFFPEADWKRQIDTMRQIRNSKVTMMAHTDLALGGSGTDNYGRTAEYWQVFYYSLASFLLTKSDLGNHYFYFNDNRSYNALYYYDEYDRIDLGQPLGDYQVATAGSARVYWREFERGYVYVNSSEADAASVMLPEASRRLTHANINSDHGSLPTITQLGLPSHHAAILLKANAGSGSGDTQAPSVPTGFSASAVSSTEARLTWSPSTDNKAVTGYYVYLNDAPLATTTATSFTHSGLAAGTTYNYRVSAFDAIPNHSAWTAAIAVTPSGSSGGGSDTQAPSVPTGFSASASSSTSAKLTWSASTDNVGVTGYYVYLDDAPLATTTGTSYTHSGLTAGTTYRYRVSAFDAVPNHSAWTAAISVTPQNGGGAGPQVSILSPANKAVVSGAITVSAEATDSKAVSNVLFKLDGKNLGSKITQAPYQVLLDTRTLPNGNHKLRAVARDADGNVTQSGVVTIKVAN